MKESAKKTGGRRGVVRHTYARCVIMACESIHPTLYPVQLTFAADCDYDRSKNQPVVIHKESLHPLKSSVWRTFYNGRVVESHFFPDATGNHVILDKIRYRSILVRLLWLELDAHDLDNKMVPLATLPQFTYRKGSLVNRLFPEMDQSINLLTHII